MTINYIKKYVQKEGAVIDPRDKMTERKWKERTQGLVRWLHVFADCYF